MKYFFKFLIILIFVSCKQKQNDKLIVTTEETNIQKFELEDCRILFNTIINDTILARVMLETGSKNLYIDKNFFEKYLDTGQKKRLELFRTGWMPYTMKDTGYYINSSPIIIQIGKQNVIFNDFYIFDFKKRKMNSDIMFPIPVNDSLKIWELNFEEQFIKLHDYEEEIAPNEYDVTDLYMYFKHYIPNQILFDLPVKYHLSDGTMEEDTLFCLFDTGSPCDIFLMNSLDLMKKYNKQKLSFGVSDGGNVPIFRTQASFFNSDHLDTVSFRFFEKPWYVPYHDIVGINFMVRYNFFIDLYHRKIYFKPIEKPVPVFSRENYEIGGAYGVFLSEMVIIDSIGEKYSIGPFARAGVKDGDTIIWFCGYSIKEQAEMDFRDLLHQYDCYHIKVLRNGDTIDLKTHKNY